MTELEFGGYDGVIASVSYTLADWVEQLQLFGAGVTGSGNGLGNTIYGDGTLANTLRGMGGDDYIVGGSATDTIEGGAGYDLMYGGVGGDVFRYLAASDTTADVAHDIIGDWSTSDRIDLTQLDANITLGGLQGFTFIGYGTADLTIGQGQLKVYRVQAENRMFVVGGINADNQADFQIELTGFSTVVTSQFLGIEHAELTGTADADILEGTTGGDSFWFTAANLTGADAVSGGSSAAIDTLTFTTAGTIAAGALAGVSGLERLQLAAGSNSLALSDAFASANAGLIVKGGSGNDTIDATAMLAANGLTVAAGTGNDTLMGGAGADVFQFSTAQLTAADVVSGGAGAALDSLQFVTAGTVAASALAGVSGIERLQLTTGTNAVTLSDAFAGANPDVIVKGSSGNDSIDATALLAGHFLSVVSARATIRCWAGPGPTSSSSPCPISTLLTWCRVARGQRSMR